MGFECLHMSFLIKGSNLIAEQQLQTVTFMLSTAGKILGRQHREIFFLFFFLGKYFSYFFFFFFFFLSFDISCKLSPVVETICRNVKSCFLGKIRKNIINLLSIQFIHRMVKVKIKLSSVFLNVICKIDDF